LSEVINRLYDECRDKLYRYFLKRVHRPDIAEELCQEVYLRMLRVANFAAIKNQQAYLFTVARNLLCELRLQGQLEYDVDDPTIQEHLSEAPDFGAEVDRETTKECLHRALRELPAKCQAAVLLHYWKGMTYEEVGRELGIGPDQVKKYVSKALAHCRLRMGRLK
jgi:RNA polymerase sigma factor (sigma-70 family)